MTHVYWDEKPEHTAPTAIVSPPADDLKALRKQLAGKCNEEIEYTPDEHTTNIRITSSRHRN